jgi:hypothetical protein
VKLFAKAIKHQNKIITSSRREWFTVQRRWRDMRKQEEGCPLTFLSHMGNIDHLFQSQVCGRVEEGKIVFIG